MDIILEDGQEDVPVQSEIAELQEDLDDVELNPVLDSPVPR